MKKNESLMATLLSIYAILLTTSIALYALIKEFEMDITLATNLLIWSATLFAPIAVLMTYTNWRDQKSSEIISVYAKDVYLSLNKYVEFLEVYSISVSINQPSKKIKNQIEEIFKRNYTTYYLYCDLLKNEKEDLDYSFIKKFLEFEMLHHDLLLTMSDLNSCNQSKDSQNENILKYQTQQDAVNNKVYQITKSLVNRVLFKHEHT